MLSKVTIPFQLYQLAEQLFKHAHTVPLSCDKWACDAEGKPIPTELRREEQSLRHNIELEDDNTAVPRSHIDDEYAHAGERDPKVLITTSRDPSSRLTQFAKELKLVVPSAQRINRGGQVMVPSVHAHSASTGTAESILPLIYCSSVKPLQP